MSPSLRCVTLKYGTCENSRRKIDARWDFFFTNRRRESQTGHIASFKAAIELCYEYVTEGGVNNPIFSVTYFMNSP